MKRTWTLVGLTAAVAVGVAYFLPGSFQFKHRETTGVSIPVTLAVSTKFIGSALVLIADANGYFADEGLAVTIQPQSSGVAAIDAAISGKALLATASDTAVMFPATDGQSIAIVATIASRITDQGIVARRDRGIRMLPDLREKRVGVTYRSSAHYMLDSALVRNGLPSSAVVKVNLPPTEMAEALKRGDVDAVATWFPFQNTALEAIGENGVSFQGADVHTYTFNLAGARPALLASPDVLRRLLRALLRAERFAHQRTAAAQAVVARATGLDATIVATQWPQYALGVRLDQKLITLLEDGSRWAIRNGYVARRELPNYLEILHTDALASIDPQAVSVIR